MTAYDWFRQRYCVRIEQTGGKEKSKKLVDELIQGNRPYVVIVDGDYEILWRKRSKHKRVVLLHRYAVENYLLEASIVSRFCAAYAAADEDRDTQARFEKFLSELEKELEALVQLDIVAVVKGLTSTPMPRSVARLMDPNDSCRLAPSRIREVCVPVREQVEGKDLEWSNSLLQKWVEKGRLIHLLRGHTAFSALRHFIEAELRRQGQKLGLDNRALLLVLSRQTWEERPHRHHQSLVRRLREAVRSAAKGLPKHLPGDVKDTSAGDLLAGPEPEA